MSYRKTGKQGLVWQALGELSGICLIKLFGILPHMETFAVMHLAAWVPWLIGWLGMGVWFGIEESWAISTKHTMKNDGTLSSMVWRLVRGRAWYHRLAFIAFTAGYVLLGYHFLFQKLPY